MSELRELNRLHKKFCGRAQHTNHKKERCKLYEAIRETWLKAEDYTRSKVYEEHVSCST